MAIASCLVDTNILLRATRRADPQHRVVYYTMKREPGDRGILATRLVGGFFVLVFAAILIPHMMPPSRLAMNENSAVTALRSVNRAQSAYAQKHPDQGFALTLSELGQGTGADAIDQQVTTGRKMRYTFAMIAGPTDLHGRITTYTVVARPERLGNDDVRASSPTNLKSFASRQRIERQMSSTRHSRGT